MTRPKSDCWDSAVPLLRALEQYTPASLSDRLAELRFEIGLDADLALFPEQSRNSTLEYFERDKSAESFRFITPKVSRKRLRIDSPLGKRERYRTLTSDAKAYVTILLQSGRLTAKGYLKPKRRSAVSELIPQRQWIGGYIDWTHSSLRCGRLEYQEVVVLPSPDYMETLDDSCGQSAYSDKRTLKRYIESAYEHMKRNAKIDFSTSLLKNHPDIRREVLRQLGSSGRSRVRGIEYEAVRKWIGKQFKKDKERFKTNSGRKAKEK